jgi:hypothetical protein
LLLFLFLSKSHFFSRPYPAILRPPNLQVHPSRGGAVEYHDVRWLQRLKEHSTKAIVAVLSHNASARSDELYRSSINPEQRAPEIKRAEHTRSQRFDLE